MAQSTCGFLDANSASPRVAASGYDCTVDTVHNIWGFCPTTVVAATDCGLAGYCIDSFNCRNGCGPLAGVDSVTTFTCTNNQHCSFLVSINGDSPATSYPYIACGDRAVTDTIYAVPTVAAVTTSTSSTTSTSITPGSTTTPTTSATTSSNNTSQTAAASSSQGNSTPVGAIVGGVVGGIAVICLTILAAILIRRRRKSHKTASPSYASVRGDIPDQTSDHLSKQPPRAMYQAPVEVSELQSFPAELSGGDTPRELYASPSVR